MAFKAKMKINFNLPELKTDEILNEIAKKVIIPDIEDRMNKGVNISGRAYAPLAESTIKRKVKKGLRTEPILATGQLRASFIVKKKSNTAVIIRPGGFRSGNKGAKTLSNIRLADILQNKGVNTKHGKRFFNFFGISQEANEEADDLIEKWIKRAIRRGGRKFIR